MPGPGPPPAVAEGSLRRIAPLVAIASLGGLLFGYETGLAAGALRSAQLAWGLDASYLVLLSTGTLIGALVGALSAGRLADLVGRRDVIMATAALFTLGAFVSAVAPTVHVLLLGRLVVGLGVGAVSIAAPLYIAEIAPAARRGALVCCFQLMITLGILLAFLGHALHGEAPDGWRYLLAMGALPGLALSGLALLLVESPLWLALNGDEEGARASLRALGAPAGALPVPVPAPVPAGPAEPGTGGERLREVFSLAGRRALFLCVGLFAFQQFVGINALLYYAAAGAAPLAPGLGLPPRFGGGLALAVINLLATLAAIALIDRIGRRPLLLLSFAGMTAGLLLLAFGLALRPGDGGPAVPLGLALFVAAFALGIGPIAWVTVAEAMPLRARGLAGGLAVASHWLFDGLASPTSLLLEAEVGRAPIFAVYALVAAAGLLLFRRVFPELRGLSLQAVEAAARRWAAGVESSRFVPYAVTTLVATGGLLTGYNFAVTAGTLVLITAEWRLSALEQGVLVSAIVLGLAIGSFCAGGLADRFGRRYLLMSTAALFVAGAFACALAPTLGWLVAARVAVGFAIGILAPTVAIYIAEIAPSAIRGRLLSFDAVTYGIGALVAYAVCLLFERVPDGWRYMFAVIALPSTLYGLLLLALPESPRWLAAVGKPGAARRMLARLAERDADRVLRAFDSGEAEQGAASWRALRADSARAPVTLGLALMFLLVFCGWDMILFYAPTLLLEIGFESTTVSFVATLGLGLVFLVMTIVSLSLIDRVGRRPLMLSGLVIMGLSLALMSLLVSLPGEGGPLLRWGLVALLALFVGVFALTLGQIAEIVVVEIFPQAIRGPGTSLAHGMRSLFAFVFSLAFPFQLKLLGLGPTFASYALVCLAGAAYLSRSLPETRGVSLEQIAALWRARAARSAP